MKRLLFFFFLLSIAFVVYAKDGFAGPDQMVSPGQPAMIGPPQQDPAYCYTWMVTPQNSGLLAGKKDVPYISINMDVVRTTTFTLSRWFKGKIGAEIEYDQVTVYVLDIEYFRYNETKDWKVVVGRPIQFSATAIPGCTEWEWKLGAGDKWTLQNGNKQNGMDMLIPKSDLLKAWSDKTNKIWFGDAFGTIRVSCKDPQGKTHTISSDQMPDPHKVKVFYDPFKNIHGGEPNNFAPPCWFLFGKKYELVKGFNENSNIQYQHEKPADSYGGGRVRIDDYGQYDQSTGMITLFFRAGTLNYQLMVFNSITGQVLTVGGRGKGLNCLAEVLAHEMYHKYIHQHKSLPGLIHTDSDEIDDNEEIQPGINNINGYPVFSDKRGNPLFPPSSFDNPDTYNISLYSPRYAAYGDQEVRCRIVEGAQLLQTFPENDWSMDTQNLNSNWMKEPDVA